MMIGLLLMFGAGCAIAAGRAAILATFEQGWPDALKALRLDAKRNYVVLAQIPPGAAIDARNAETVRLSMKRRVFASNVIGHVAVAWQCEGRKGIASQSGEFEHQGLRMILGGWGLTPFLSTFTDGRLKARDSFRAKHARIFAKGHGQVVAVEVTSAACNRMKDFLVRYVTAPHNPQHHFGLLFDPGKFQGGGCVSFGIAMAAKAGILSGAYPFLWRRTSIHQAALGRLQHPPDDTIPFAGIAANPKQVHRVSFGKLLRGPLDQGPVTGHVTFIDPELLFAALTGARDAAHAPSDWHHGRLLDDPSGAVRKAYVAGRKWASAFAAFRIVDPKGLNALVIER